MKFSSLDTISIGSVLIRFPKWTPEFNFAEESPLALVWVRIPDLPLHLFSRRTLFMIAKLLGTPVEMDEFAADGYSGSFAHVCVEIDVSQPCPGKILVGWGSHGLHFDVVYKRVPFYCSECKMFGHSSQRCAHTGFPSIVVRDKAQGKQPDASPSYVPTPLVQTHDVPSGPISVPPDPGLNLQRCRRRHQCRQHTFSIPLCSPFGVLQVREELGLDGSSGAHMSHVHDVIVEDIHFGTNVEVTPMPTLPIISVVVTFRDF
ncbi:uncharacterized protein LOC142541598 [Primulina tabacum]|uniref:uncharacterized protein LOC142541598 n=1 Tax=Primulina tabacum TaxID=48773 RepID=UPI003F5977D3